MTGPEHYRKAEELLEGSLQGLSEQEIARAQAHATLALAAATAMVGYDEDDVEVNGAAWRNVCGVQR